MPYYQYKREPLSDDDDNRLTNACERFDEKITYQVEMNADITLTLQK
jgi:hypothetical protein